MSISWIHLTDWHIGQSEEFERFPNLEDVFFEDLKKIVPPIGGIDLVFFTGDFVNKGLKSEYEILETRLMRFWDEFRKYGKEPLLVPLPGNHDLLRPEEYSMPSLSLRGFLDDVQLQRRFWDIECDELRNNVCACFSAYSEWLNTTKIPILRGTDGPLPGDQLLEFEKEGAKVGILSLNTTYLQIRDGDYSQKLWVSPRQVPKLDNGTYLDILKSSDIKVLLTHHPESWLSPTAIQSFRSDIARSGVFDIHLCGHLHLPKTSCSSEGGSALRHVLQGASFFGLEHYEANGHQETRIHGYAAGTWDAQDEIIVERRWPRIAYKKQDGGWGLVPNPSEYLTNDSYAERQWSRSVVECPSEVNSRPTTCCGGESAEIFEPAPAESRSFYPRLDGSVRLEHNAIRADERQKLQSLLQSAPVIGIVTDWGMGTNEFIASCIFGSDVPASVQGSAKSENLFVLNCDAFLDAGEFEAGLKQQFGVAFHQFAQSISSLPWACLVLQGIQQAAIEGEQGDRFRAIIDLLVDYSDTLKIILTGRTDFWGSLPTVRLSALDLHETRSYLEVHPKGRPELLTVESVERLHFSSGGLPIQIDSLLRRLEIASLDSVLEEHQTVDGDAPYFNSLLTCIRRLGSGAVDDGASRSLDLLRSLSTLPFGTTIELIKHFNRVRPFYPVHAEELYRLTLIDAVPIQYDSTGISAHPTKTIIPSISPKILRVPKQVRDCVWGDMTDAERKKYIDLAAEFIFGDKWRTGRIKLKKLPFEYMEYLGRGPGNEYSVIRELVTYCLSDANNSGLKRSLQLAVQYCLFLQKSDRYKDLKMVAGPLIHTIESLEFEGECRSLHRLCGRASRLTGAYEDAIKHFERAIDLPPKNAHNELNGRIYIELSSCYKALGRNEDAKAAAETARSLAKHGSLLESQAKSKLVNYDVNQGASSALVDLEQEARKKSWESHANDLAIILSTLAPNEHKIELLDRVIFSNEDGRNKYRAVVSKGKLLMKWNMLDRMSVIDECLLAKAYQYFHAQRMAEFAECHKVFWALLEKKGRLAALYSLFRHSSFIWRLEGNLQNERIYLEKLAHIKDIEKIEKSEFTFEIAYFIKRAKVLIVKMVSISSKLKSSQ